MGQEELGGRDSSRARGHRFLTLVMDSVLLLVQEATDDMSVASTPVVADAVTHLLSSPVTTLRVAVGTHRADYVPGFFYH